VSFNYHPEGPGFTAPAPLEDRTVRLERVRPAVPAPIMAAPVDGPLTTEHRKVLDEIETLAKEARRHLAGWGGRGSDSDPAAAADMGSAIAAMKQLVKVGKELHSGLVMEDTVTAVEDDRESYSIRRSGKSGSV